MGSFVIKLEEKEGSPCSRCPLCPRDVIPQNAKLKWERHRIKNENNRT
jgi:hypothetical protein